MHRLIVTSSAYRQSSRPDPEGLSKDAGNRLLWRKRPTRLEAEMVRDAMLATAGVLNLATGGPSFRDHEARKATGTPTILYVPADPATPGLNRRTLYRAWARGGGALPRRLRLPRPLDDGPSRAATTTPLQALALMNNAMVLHLSDAFATRLVREAGPDAEAQVTLAYRLAPGATARGGRIGRGVGGGRPLRRGRAGPCDLQQQRVHLSRLMPASGASRGAPVDRRDFFCWMRNGLAGAAAASLMLRDGTARASEPGDDRAAGPHFPPRATRAIHICLAGAMSQVDSFDYKPGLIAAHGQSLVSPTRPDVFFGQVGLLRRPDWDFQRRGESGCGSPTSSRTSPGWPTS